ncbi:hypothetical protein EV182_006706, partial [Spiromyces aspiralis]
VVYDITDSDSFENAKRWVEELKSQDIPDLVIALVGNKSDLYSHRTVSTSEGTWFSHQEGTVFYETSAKLGLNVTELFDELAEMIKQGRCPGRRSELSSTANGATVDISQSQNNMAG